MRKLESILVSIDRGEDARIVLAKAGTLAQRVGAKLELYLCDAECAYALKHVYTPRGVDAAREASLAESRRYLAELRDAVLPPDVTCEIEAACESPLYESIVHKIQRSRPDLVIRALGGHTPAGPCLSVANWALVRTCPVPLMLVGTRSWGRLPRIAATVDVSSAELPELTRAIIETAQHLKMRTGGALDVIHVASDSGPGIGAQARADLLQQRVSEAQADAQLHVVPGEPVERLPGLAAQHRYDVLVLGTLSHRKTLNAEVGTLTGRLLDTLSCDFLLVKPPSYVSPVREEKVTSAMAPAS
jgi:universal stress protein E